MQRVLIILMILFLRDTLRIKYKHRQFSCVQALLPKASRHEMCVVQNVIYPHGRALANPAGRINGPPERKRGCCPVDRTHEKVGCPARGLHRVMRHERSQQPRTGLFSYQGLMYRVGDGYGGVKFHISLPAERLKISSASSGANTKLPGRTESDAPMRRIQALLPE